MKTTLITVLSLIWGGFLYSPQTTIISFEAERRSETEVKLSWSTGIETDNEGFEVQRMLEGAPAFETVQKVEALGISEEKVNYSCFDENDFSGLSYYRIKQTDASGRVNFSDVRMVKGTSKKDEDVKVIEHPEPIGDELAVRLWELPHKVKYADVTIMNGLGDIVYETTVGVASYKLLTISEVAEFEKGNYILSMKLNNGERVLWKFKKL